MNAGTSIDPLDPKGSHVPLFVTAVSVGILQGLLNPLPCYPYAILGSTSFIKSQTKDEVKKENPHPLLSFIRHCSNHANPKQRYKKLQEDNEKAYVHYFTPT